MSVRIMSMVWDYPVFRGNTKLIMLCLADFSNDEGYCWPSLERIANKCGISRSTLKVQLANLCNDGYIRKELRKKITASGEITNDTNVYWLTIEKLQNTESDLGQNSPQPKSGLGRNSSKGRPESDPKPSIDPPYSINTPIVPKLTESKKCQVKTKTSSLPEDFSVKPVMAEWYSQQVDFVLDVNTATAQWRDAMLSKQRKYADWIAAWRNGMRNANKWAIERESRQQSGVNSYSRQDYSAPKGFRS
ncbi:helix-turn-helix domain-containing protein [Photobacterium frigidiphilum]|uniref:helix-turn-helix domain-containing protein n=1 Tax=Photobacterium frigidiphilum TaxID=264736 RepID=UPI003D09C4A5